MKKEQTSRETAEVAEAAAEMLGAAIRDGARKDRHRSPAQVAEAREKARGCGWWQRALGVDRPVGPEAAAASAGGRGHHMNEDPRPGGGGGRKTTTDPDAGKAEDEPQWKRELRQRLAWARREIARERGQGAEASGPESGVPREDRGRERGRERD